LPLATLAKTELKLKVGKNILAGITFEANLKFRSKVWKIPFWLNVFKTQSWPCSWGLQTDDSAFNTDKCSATSQ
jgi:hypothetical protein